MGPNKKYAQSIYGDEPTTMDELGFAIIKVLNDYQENRISGRGKNSTMTSSPKVQCIGLAWEVHKSDMVSNSHSSPEGFSQNWCGHGDEKGIPRGYPGWSGRVWVRYKTEKGYSFGSDPFRRTLVHTGTGGGGSYDGPWSGVSSARWRRHGHDRSEGLFPYVNCFSWDFRIFDADWPIISEVYEKQRMWAELSNQKVTPISHRFCWEDPDTKAADIAFIEEWEGLKNVSTPA